MRNREWINTLSGIIDLHVHTSPDVRERRQDDIELVQAAKRMGARAIVLKSHVVPTMDRAWISEKVVPGIRVFGGITLNPEVGGLNRAAVENAIKMNAKVVWLPTGFAANERKRLGKSDGIETVAGSRVVPELVEILKLIASHDLILGTGHLAPAETLCVVDKAKDLGVRKIVINHPEWTTIAMSIEEQLHLAAYGVFFERCYARNVGNNHFELNFAKNLQAIQKVGYESTVISTDVGRIENPVWAEAVKEYLLYLQHSGISQHALDTMTKTNAAGLLGLE